MIRRQTAFRNLFLFLNEIKVFPASDNNESAHIEMFIIVHTKNHIQSTPANPDSAVSGRVY